MFCSDWCYMVSYVADEPWDEAPERTTTYEWRKQDKMTTLSPFSRGIKDGKRGMYNREGKEKGIEKDDEKARENGEVIYPQSRWLRFTWRRQNKNRRREQQRYSAALHWHGDGLFLCLSSSPFLFVSIQTHLYWRQGREGERFWSSAYLLLTMAPLRPSKQGENTDTHTFSRHRGEQLGSVLHWKPHFPLNQTDR